MVICEHPRDPRFQLRILGINQVFTLTRSVPEFPIKNPSEWRDQRATYKIKQLLQRLLSACECAALFYFFRVADILRLEEKNHLLGDVRRVIGNALD